MYTNIRQSQTHKNWAVCSS